MPTITISADSPPPSAPLPDSEYASEAQRHAKDALAAARSAGANRDAIEAILEQVEVGAAFISTNPDNRLKKGTDGGYFVKDDFDPDPLVHYILARGNI